MKPSHCIAAQEHCARRNARRKKGETGSALVEFGLVLIPTLGMMFMAMNVAWIFFGWACLQEAVREGVRYGITGPVQTGMDAAITQFTESMAMGFLTNSNNPQVQIQYFSPTTLTEVTGQTGATQAGNVLKVTASMTLNSLVPVWQSATHGGWMGTFAPWSLNLVASSADVLETGSPAPSE